MSVGPLALVPVPSSATSAVIPEHDLLRPIACGAYGQVWLARNRLGAYRAVKIVYRASFDHDRPFEREFAGIKAFEPISRSHEGLVDLLQVGRDDAAGYFYYVMELADAVENPKPEAGVPKEGRTTEYETPTFENVRSDTVQGPPPRFLDSRQADGYLPRTLVSELRLRGRLPLDDCIHIGLAMTSALAHLHRQGLVHRDVKPSNIIFVGGRPKLADVGLVIGVSEAQSFVGTEGFIPPEGPGTTQADLYSLGILLYVLSTGKNHQDFPEPPADLAAQANHQQWLEFDAVVHKACQANVRERYPTAEAMHAELQLLQAGQSVRRKHASQHHWAVGRKVALAVAVVGTAAAAWVWSPYLRHPPKPEATRLYELGRWYYNKLTPEDHRKALEFLNQAVAVDPGFVKPYRELTALCVWGQRGVFADAEEKSRKLQEIAALAASHPNLPEGHAALSWDRFLDHDWPGAENEIVRAIQLDPDYQIARDVYAFYLSMQCRVEEAMRQAQRSQEIDPTARTSAMVASWPFMAARQFDKAIAQLKRVVDLDKNFAEAHNFLGRCYEAQSNYVAAIEEWRIYDSLIGHEPARVAASYDALRQAYDTGGEQGYLRKYIELIRENEPLPESEQIFFAQDVAGYYARLGENQTALDEIEKHLDEFPLRAQLKFEPLFDTLHQEPRFQELLKRVGLDN